MPSPYPFHKIALAPLLPNATQDQLEKSAASGVALGEREFEAFLHQQGLAPLWDERIAQHTGKALRLSSELRNSLHQARLQATGEYLIQKNSLNRVKDILDEAKVDHVVFKGAHTRELYYDTPSLRPAVDIDVLVRPEDKIAAIEAFQKKGFEFHGVPANISHETCLTKGKTTIDLHWNILRPGRTRAPMTGTILEARQDIGSHWAMSHEATLFVMLVHPVFTKYSTTPQAALVRLLDLVYLLEKKEIDWKQLIGWLEQAGLKTCGWITLTWLEVITGYKIPNKTHDALKPGKLRQKYLRNWLASNRASKFLDKPLLVKLGFTLPAHDSFADAIRALWQAEKHRRQGPQILLSIESRPGPA